MQNLLFMITKIISLASLIAFIFLMEGCHNNELPKSGLVPAMKSEPGNEKESEEIDGYDEPGQLQQYEFDRTKDVNTNTVPRERYLLALKKTIELKQAAATFNTLGFGTWAERGPNSDAVGPSSLNTRPNNGVASGRTRTILVDKADATGKTVFMAGIDGGIWKTTDITASPATWTLVNDFLNNLAISFMCQDPSNTNNMYACTGESFSNGDAVTGVGVFKSSDHGATWALLSSTTSYKRGTRILCDAAGNVYLGTRGTGLLRSINGGLNWTIITPSTGTSDIGDLELSSTGRLHVSTGVNGTCSYSFTDNPTTVTTTTWTAPTTPFPVSPRRAELGCSGNVLYALPSDVNAQVPTIYKSVDGGANWAATIGQPPSGWPNGQAWYSLTCGVDPSDPNNVIVGGLDNYKSTNGGNTWAQISVWYGTSGQYVHADNHTTIWYDNGNKLLFGSDGGVFYSADKGVTIRDRNVGLRIKQFYSVAIHPTQMNYFLAGAQDNGVHQFTNAGLSSTVEVTGGDGAFVAIDQDQPQYQYGSYIRANFRRSTDNGATWSSIDLNSNGLFIDPYDYDDANNKLYAGYVSSQYLRWNDPQTGNSFYAQTVSSFNGSVSAVHVSPFGSDTVYFGTTGGRVVKVSGTSTLSPVDVNITDPAMTVGAFVNCVNTGTSSKYLVSTRTNYGINNIWVSSNYGTSWTTIDGDLPDMPVYWAMYVPGDNTKMIIATETGVWYTSLINGASTTWTPSTSFPTVRTDMLQYRQADGMVAAATHGRGLWTQVAPTIVGLNYYTFTGNGNWNVAANWANNTIPPATLAPGEHIVINPSGQCTLNIPYTLSTGGRISLMPGKTFNLLGNLTINVP